MKFDCCCSCVFFQPELLTEVKHIPRACNCPNYVDVFGVDVGGFPSGIAVIHCAYHTMPSPWFGDYLILDEDNKALSYVDTKKRDWRHIRVPQLFDNSKNIKIRKHEKREFKIRNSEVPF